MKIVISCLFLFFSTWLLSQENDYVVVHVDGKITQRSENRLLKTGDVIKGNPEFNFSSVWDKAKLWGDKSGYWYLYPKEAMPDQRSFLGFSFLKNLQSQKEYTATRGDDEQLYYLFLKNGSLLFDKEIRVFFTPQDQDSHYFFEFTYGEDRRREKLPLDDHKKLRITNMVLQLSTAQIDIGQLHYAHIGFHDADTGEDTILKGAVYAFADMDAIATQLALLKKLLIENGDAPKSIQTALQSYLEDTFGSDIQLDDFQLSLD